LSNYNVLRVATSVHEYTEWSLVWLAIIILIVGNFHVCVHDVPYAKDMLLYIMAS